MARRRIMMDTNMMMNGMGMMFWGLLSFLIALVLIFLFFVGIAFAVKWLWGQKPLSVTGDRESALDILKKRYAKGEISKEEFDRIKEDLK